MAKGNLDCRRAPVSSGTSEERNTRAFSSGMAFACVAIEMSQCCKDARYLRVAHVTIRGTSSELLSGSTLTTGAAGAAGATTGATAGAATTGATTGTSPIITGKEFTSNPPRPNIRRAHSAIVRCAQTTRYGSKAGTEKRFNHSLSFSSTFRTASTSSS